jgi:putative colanic acid biosynthesis acetyltransferase WcaF
MVKTDLSRFSNREYRPGSFIKRTSWYLISIFFFKTAFPWPSFLKGSLLSLFGAEIGRGVVFKPSLNIKYPWYLEVGDYSWIGENVWIDNLATIKIGSHACVSQGAMLLTGNHNFKKTTFDLMVKTITIEDGVWIGAQAVVCPGVFCASHSVLTVGSVATSNLQPYSVYSGNPAMKIKNREIIEG